MSKSAFFILCKISETGERVLLYCLFPFVKGVQRGRSTYYGMLTIVGEASSLCPSNKKLL